MKEDLLDIRAGIKTGRYVNEATVSQGIVQRLLHILGWPVYNTEVVAPEYSLDGRRVDYALCPPMGAGRHGRGQAGRPEPRKRAPDSPVDRAGGRLEMVLHRHDADLRC